MKSLNRMVLAAIATSMLSGGASVLASESDDRIESSIEKSYVFRTYLKDDSVKASSEDGVVTLSGTVAQESHKSLAEDTAANQAGVSRVDNQLATTAEKEAENADTWMGRKIKLALLFHRNVSASDTTVDVKDGAATLTGTASSLAQKELATSYAKDIEGVISVENNMVVEKAALIGKRSDSQKLDDASITAQVKGALRAHHSTSAIETKVVTREGTVTLTGIALNTAEKSLVSKLVSDIWGVTSVNNEMTIQAPQTI